MFFTFSRILAKGVSVKITGLPIWQVGETTRVAAKREGREKE